MVSVPAITYRPVVNIPGRKPYACGQTFGRFDDAQRWAAGFVSVPGTLIKPGSSVTIGDTVFAIIPQAGAWRLQFLGPARKPTARLTAPVQGVPCAD